MEQLGEEQLHSKHWYARSAETRLLATRLPDTAPTNVASAEPSARNVNVGKKPYCDHKRGTWCTCKKFSSKPVYCGGCFPKVRHKSEPNTCGMCGLPFPEDDPTVQHEPTTINA